MNASRTSTTKSLTFEEAVSRIKKKYKELNHTDGGCFLNSPSQTFAPSTRIIFLALNPRSNESGQAGLKKEDPKGNSYRTGKWIDGKQESPLQIQVQRFYMWMAEEGGIKDWKSLMDQSLVSNVCPFSSKSWKDFPRKRE